MLRTIAAFDRLGEENAFAVLARATQLAAQGRDIINLGIGQPDFRTPDFIVEAAVKALRDGHHGYTPAVGILPLREAVAADLHKRFAVSVSPDSVMIFPGGKPTMFMSILMFGEPGADILYPDPGFPIYRSMIEFTGARPIPVPIREENNFAFSAEETLESHHAADAAPHSQLAGQSDRRRDAESGSRQARRRTGAPSRCRGDVGRNLRPHALRRRDACVPAAISVDPRPAHPAQRLVEDLRHDRLAARLCGVAGQALRLRAQARGQSAFLRQRRRRNMPGLPRSPARRTRWRKWSPSSTSGAKSWSTASTGCRACPAPRPRARSTRSPTSSAPAGRRSRSPRRCSKNAGVALIGGPDFGVLGEGYVRVSYANSTENILRALDRIGEFLSAAARRREPPLHPFCVSRKPTSTIASPASCEMLGTSPSAR